MRRVGLAILLVVATVSTYARVLAFPYVEWDDPQYVSRNEVVLSGLNAESIRWAVENTETGNWQPLTWLSYMAETHFFGPDPGLQHAVNLVLHVLNALLLFWILRSSTQREWASWLVAMLFALHPLHAESVAWISERKGLLATLFALLAIWSYLGHTPGRIRGRYGGTLLLFAASLLSKATFATLPLLLLLLDVWPLGRLERSATERAGGAIRVFGRLLVEKFPLLLLGVSFSALTFRAQQAAGAMFENEFIASSDRFANAVVAIVWYVAKTIWPSGLSALYTHPYIAGGTPWSSWTIAGSVALLLFVSIAVLAAWRQRYLAVGWFWYLFTILPVLGFVQVGIQPFADRYSYLPSIGLYLMVVYGLDEALARRPSASRRLLGVCAASCGVVLLGFAEVARRQVETWQSSTHLFLQMLRVSPTNSVAHFKLANEYRDQGKTTLAIEHYREAIRIHPSYALAKRELVRIFGEQERGGPGPAD